MPALAVPTLPADVSDVRAEPDATTFHSAANLDAAAPAPVVERPAVGTAAEHGWDADAATDGAGGDPDGTGGHPGDRARIPWFHHRRHGQRGADHPCHLRTTGAEQWHRPRRRTGPII